MRNTSFSRRTLLGSTAAVAAASMMPRIALSEAKAKPNSEFCGVQIGVITYSYRSVRGPASKMLSNITQCGISSIELMGNVPEALAGGRTAPLDKFKAVRKAYNDAGVNIHVVKFGNIGDRKMSQDQMEQYFKIAKALGATGITREIDADAARNTRELAEKYQIKIAMHNHTQLTPTTYDADWFKENKHVGINLDIGHYAARNNVSAIAFMKKYHDRIISLHLKDRKFGSNGGKNMPFGQGDSAVAEVLQYMKKTKATFPADIELEYSVPKDSDAIKEVTRCVQFCKKALA